MKKWLSGGVAASVIAMSLTLFGASAANAVEATVPVSPNPALPDTCAMDIAISLDLSNSVEDPQLVDMRAGVAQLAEELSESGLPVRLALHNFASNAPAITAESNAPLPLTSLDDAGVQTVTDWVNGIQRPAAQQGGTNWDRAFNQITTNPQVSEYDALLFVTDGNPTQYGSPAQGPGNSTDLATINAAVTSANALKETGTRIVGVGVTDNLSDLEPFHEHMRQVSGPLFADGSDEYPVNPEVDYVNTSFDQIADMLLSIVQANCAEPGLELDKTSDPVSGTNVLPGETITYTVSAENVGNTVLDPVEILDDLSGVLSYATYNDDIVTQLNGEDVTSGAATISGDQLSWTGLLSPADIVTITYSVTVNESVSGELVRNLVTASGTPPTGPPVIPPPVETEHPIIVPGFEITKSADPESGSTVLPGETITYTVTGENTGDTPLDSVTIHDDLSGVFEHAGYNDDVSATSGSVSVDGDALVWNGSLQPNESVTITYSVTVNADAAGVLLNNVASGEATPLLPDPEDPNGPLIPGDPITPPSVETEHPVPAPGFEIAKSADPADGTAVNPGDTITYTVTGANTGDTLLDPVVLTDDLSAVLGNAEYNGDAVALVDGEAAGAVALDGTELVWTGALEAGQSVTLTYSVTVNADAAGVTLNNVVSGEATPPGQPPITPPSEETEHPVPDPGFEIAKSADPADGTVVNPGDTITYTVTGENTGDTVLNPVTLTDDLSGVLGNAEYDGNAIATIDGESAGDLVLDGTELVWTGSLEPGQSVTITYSVTVNADAAGVTLNNVVSGEATPPGQPPITPPSEETEHPVPDPGFEVAKSADPADGTAVNPGDTITYTVTGANTGDTVLNSVVLTDDLSSVLDNASYNGDASATGADGTLTVEGDTLLWTGVLGVGESVTITYSVTVNEDAAGAILNNVVSGEATPPGQPPITPPSEETEHPVPGFEIAKSADPADGTAVNPGDTITYTVIGENTGATVLDPVTVSDDLSGVLGNAEYNGDAIATIDGESAGDLVLDGTELVWTGSLQPGESVTITYSVTVNDDAAGAILNNVVSGEATPPGQPPITPPTEETEHPVPGFEIAKSADPADGTEVHPGDTITYTVIGENTGATVLDPVTVSDDLSGVLGNAEYNGDAVATIDGEPAGEVVLEGNELVWTGVLEVGESVTITYSVTVNEDAAGAILNNVVSGEATPPGQPPITPPTEETEHPVPTPGFEVAKSANPTSGTAVDPGETITYTVTGTNTGETVLDPVTITDDLTDVLAHADYNGDVVATIDGQAAGDVLIEGTELVWTGVLEIGQTVTITYSVTVHGDAAGEVLHNIVTGEATPPGGPSLTPPPSETQHPVNVPGFSVWKSADPETGTAVDPGDVVTYTVTGVNTGETVLDPVTITDDLTDVLAHADYNGDVVATIDGEPAGDVSIEGTELVWTGALAVGQTVTITYSVTVHADAGGETLHNIVTGEATPPGGHPPIETPPSETEHPVNEPGFEVVKSANPETGTAVDPGETITYTVTGVNTGETVLDPVTITDDLSGVLAHADYNGDAVATIDGEAVGEVVLEGTELVWTGVLEIGQTVTITYSVTVHADAGGETLHNIVTGEATPPGGHTLTPPPSETEHPVKESGFEFSKTSDPESGTTVEAGSTVNYTLTGVNTGETVLDPVTITDGLSEVLAHADYNGDAVATIDGVEVEAPTLTGDTLTWIGVLEPGQTVTITYSVTVHDDADGETLRNIAVGSATPPGGETLTPPPGTTEHPIAKELPRTGTQLAPWLAVGLVLMLIGGALLLKRRQRI